jgi:hypothetical protein
MQIFSQTSQLTAALIVTGPVASAGAVKLLSSQGVPS